MTSLHLPIFPLPDLTFFPRTLLPAAHLRAALSRDDHRLPRRAIAGSPSRGSSPGYEASYEGQPPVHEVVGERQDRALRAAGRRAGSTSCSSGECRARIERELPTDTLYRLVRRRPLADVGADRPAVSDLRAA